MENFVLKIFHVIKNELLILVVFLDNTNSFSWYSLCNNPDAEPILLLKLLVSFFLR